MALTAVVWNIEQFGNRFGTSSQKKMIENLRALLIDDLLRAVTADVLVIQELRKEGVPYLKQLKSGLGDWHFDWLPGAQVVSGTLSSYDQLGFAQTANSEGYGVFWRGGTLDQLPGAMSAGQDTLDPGKGKKRPSYINLATEGKKLKFDQQSLAPICFDSGSDLVSIGFPHSVCPQAVNNTITTRSGETYGSDEAIQQEIGSRRPCRIQLRVSSSRTIPLVVYHAPVGQQSSRSPIYGTLIGCSVDVLQFTNPSLADCVYAGDFNVVGITDQATLTRYLPTLGYAAPVFDPSMVHVFKDNNTFRTGTGVFGSARDLVFVKAPSGRAPTAAIRDVLAQDLIDPKGFMRRRLQINPTSTTLGTVTFPALVSEKYWRQEEADVAQAYLDNAKTFPHGADAYTAAAIMYTTFVSDHLPIVITYA